MLTFNDGDDETKTKKVAPQIGRLPAPKPKSLPRTISVLAPWTDDNNDGCRSGLSSVLRCSEPPLSLAMRSLNLVHRTAVPAVKTTLGPLPGARRWRSSESQETGQKAATASLSPRWLSDLKQRIGKCMSFGLTSQQTEEAGRIVQEIAKDWRELVAGSEGFLTGPRRRGMHRQEVVWGEMDSMVCGIVPSSCDTRSE